MTEGWIRIQQKTFTAWMNLHLSERGLKVESMETDLSDGVLLCALLELLSNKKIQFSGKPKNDIMRRENCQQALNFIKVEEKIRLENIGAGDLFGGSLKLWLGLIYTLILHYQVGSFSAEGSGSSKGATGKQIFLNYLTNQGSRFNIPPVTNLTTSLRDGVVLTALIRMRRPDLVDAPERLDRANGIENVTEALRVLEKDFAVPHMVAAEDFGVDEQSMMAFFSTALPILEKVPLHIDCPAMVMTATPESSPAKRSVLRNSLRAGKEDLSEFLKQRNTELEAQLSEKVIKEEELVKVLDERNKDLIQFQSQSRELKKMEENLMRAELAEKKAQEALKEAQSEKDALDKRCETLDKELKEQKARTDAELATVMGDLVAVRKQAVLLNDENEKESDQISQLKKQLEEAEKEIDGLKQANQGLSKETKTESEEIDRLRKQVDGLQQDKTDLKASKEAEVARLTKELEDLRKADSARLERGSQREQAQEGEIHQLQQELRKKQETIGELEREMAKSVKELEAETERKMAESMKELEAEIDKKVNALNVEKAAQLEKQKELQDELDSLKKEVLEAQESDSKSQKQLAALLAASEGAQKDLESSSKELKKRDAEIARLKLELKGRKGNQEEVDGSRKEIKKRDVEISKLTKKVDAEAEAVEEMTKKNAALTEKNTELMKSLKREKDKSAEAEKLAAEVKQLKASILANDNKYLKNLEETNNTHHKQVKKLNNTIMDHNVQIEKLKEDKRNSAVASKELNSKMKASLKEISVLKNEIVDLQRQLSDNNAKFDAEYERERYEKLKAEMDEIVNSKLKSQLEIENQSLNSEVDRNVKKIEDLQKRISSLKSSKSSSGNIRAGGSSWDWLWWAILFACVVRVFFSNLVEV